MIPLGRFGPSSKKTIGLVTRRGASSGRVNSSFVFFFFKLLIQWVWLSLSRGEILHSNADLKNIFEKQIGEASCTSTL